ncbi:hypothetical protein P170DRAFT_430901 [Aspergillus steynii IBT 23096]|uniref:Uncharacterized protein n=1 Tax=Aspergillus steynii IBT 23096 TaxID=1392250 RepID=A0A2I2FTC9_9EURO|nr:uncharacterized protein P170DRAFT_430901 [Aspergillus steynii IBT 23096]PLB43895.1 hypothetical protein P170DRAFT_430901 [Aspergillus steynii IBT 23096]
MAHVATSAEDARHPPPIPPSPTLSNPDMILPFDGNERESSTPSPPFNLPSLSHLQSFYGPRTASTDFAGDSTRNGTYAPVYRPQKKGFPRHTWLHEGHEASRRLSDIGEEDTPSPASYLGGFSKNAHVVTSSPVPYRVAEDNENKDAGAWSSSSSSTISATSETSSEGTKGRAQGQSVVSQEVDSMNNDQLRQTIRAIETGTNGDPSRLSVVSTTEEGSPADELSSVILSSEAERILENAKKRLTLMEGNLTRARSSVRVSPSLPTSPTPSGNQPLGLGQPVGGLYQSISRADRRVSTLRPRATYSASQDSSNNRHSRVYSETTLPSTSLSSLPPASPSLSRSMSALGSSTASNFNNDDRSFQYAPNRAYLTHRASINSLQPASQEQKPSDTPHGLGISTPEENDQLSTVDEFDSSYQTYDPPSRSQSQLQVRDLQDQMKGLHIKISSLKVKTQEDNLRRRSLQSLRTPSPLTAADHWYNNPLETRDHSNLNPGRGHTPDYARERRSNESNRERDHARYGQETVGANGTARPSGQHHAPPASRAHQPAEEDDNQSVIESLYEDAQEGEYDTDGSSGSEIDREALDEILREPLDDDLQDPLGSFPPVPVNQDSRPHEEREDAFDYEHFILHSALGNYTQNRMRRKSEVSTSSVETTRPAQDSQPPRHARTNSDASVSTMATFATATEGDPDDFENVLYWDRRFNAELLAHPQYAEEENGDESENMGTPRANRQRDSNEYWPAESLTTPQRSESTTTGSATPTALASTLVSTVRAAASPHPNSENSNMGLNNDDTRLLEHLFQSLGDVCMDLQTITTSADPDPKHVRLLRWRLDAARRVLDGELDTD